MQGNLQLEPWILVSQEHSSHHSGHSSYAIRREQLKVDQAALGRQQWSFPVPSEMRQYGVRTEMVKIWFCFLHRPSHWPLVCLQFFVGERALLGRLQLSYGKLLIQKKEELGNGLSAFSQRSNSLGPAERGADGTGREGDPQIHPDPPPPRRPTTCSSTRRRRAARRPYLAEDADGTRHPHLPDPHHGDLVAGNRAARGHGGDQLLLQGRHNVLQEGIGGGSV